jgi:hypothetical protein
VWALELAAERRNEGASITMAIYAFCLRNVIQIRVSASMLGVAGDAVETRLRMHVGERWFKRRGLVTRNTILFY